MTRINVVPIEELANKHLFAEFREITRVGKALQKSLNRFGGFDFNEIPDRYVLGKGHVKFFYNKGQYLHNRFNMLREELLKRGYNIDTSYEFNSWDFPVNFYKNYVPTKDAIRLNRQRIMERMGV